MNHLALLSIACSYGLGTLVCSPAQAQTCPFTFSHDADSLTYTCTENTTGVFDLKVTITDDGSPTVAVIVNDLSGGGSPVIRDLVFELIKPSGTGPLVTATVAGPQNDPENLAGLSSVSIETSTGGELYLEDLVVAGDLGSTEVHRLDNLRVLGDVTGDIDILEIAGVYSGSVGTIDVDGDFLGSIDFDPDDTGSKIDTLSVGGDIGTSMSPVSISASATIGLISCDNLYGDVATLHSGTIRRIETSGVLEGNIQSAKIKVAAGGGGTGDPGVFIGSGDYKDTLACTIELAGDIDIPGNIGDEATVQVASIPSGYSVTIGGDVEAGGEVQVLGDLAGTLDVTGDIGGTVTIYDNLSGTIACDSAGLAAQILINQQNGSAEWSGDVVIGSTTLGPGETGDNELPYYGVLSSTLGGGAVGLVPFMYHAKDSAPDHDTVITTGAFTGTVTVAHYGPVADADTNLSTTPPVKVYRLSLVAPPGQTVPDPATTALCDNRWTDVTSSYTYGVSGRAVTVSGTFANWRAYQIIPNDLVCNIDGTPDVVYAQGWQGTIGCNGLDQTYGYGFQVKTGFDLNQNQMVESGDVETWLIEPADFDGDDDADVIDLSLLVDAVVNGSGE